MVYERCGCHLYVAIAESVRVESSLNTQRSIRVSLVKWSDGMFPSMSLVRFCAFFSAVVSVVVEPLCTKVLCRHPLLIQAKARSLDRTRLSVKVELGAAVLNTRVKSQG